MATRQEANINYLKAVGNGDSHSKNKRRISYFEGVPCRKHGHTLRYADKGRNCVECKKVYEQTPERKTWHKSPRVLEMKKKNSKEWYDIPENKKYHNDWMNVYNTKRYKNDPTFRVKALLQSQLNVFLKQVGTIKENRTHEILGYNAREFHDHLESHFQKGMTWDNQGKGGWVIDHVRPKSWFTKGQEKECFALSNLMPEWEDWNDWKRNNFEGSSDQYPMPRKSV